MLIFPVLFSFAEVENKVDIPDICVELHGEVISLREGQIMAHGIDSIHFFKDDVIDEEEEEGDENDQSTLGSAQIVITAATPMVEESEQPFPPPPVSIIQLHVFLKS